MQRNHRFSKHSVFNQSAPYAAAKCSITTRVARQPHYGSSINTLYSSMKRHETRDHPPPPPPSISATILDVSHPLPFQLDDLANSLQSGESTWQSLRVRDACSIQKCACMSYARPTVARIVEKSNREQDIPQNMAYIAHSA